MDFIQPLGDESTPVRLAFACFLGLYAHSAKPYNRRKNCLERVLKEEYLQERIIESADTLKVNVGFNRGKLFCRDSNFIEILDKSLRQNFVENIAADAEEKAFLTFFAAPSKARLKTFNGTSSLFFNISDPEALLALGYCLFSQGIYPRINFKSGQIEMGGMNNLRQWLEIEPSFKRRNEIGIYLANKEKKEQGVDKFLAVRNKVRELYGTGEKPVWAHLANSYGLNRDTPISWCADIIENNEGKCRLPIKIPPVARRYLTLRQYFSRLDQKRILVFNLEKEFYLSSLAQRRWRKDHGRNVSKDFLKDAARHIPSNSGRYRFSQAERNLITQIEIKNQPFYSLPAYSKHPGCILLCESDAYSVSKKISDIEKLLRN